eukprot:NODE_11831_length_1262_cov_14.798238.p1 GENE.NODE_11831_length_1262_cov_14.798238~~NODE_11831_length_1262_cov_14.798238.p1  ORF type:complete len:338 (+),score=78.48 NODE_11831_length_1262_cov_14.798238:149-1015(+)
MGHGPASMCLLDDDEVVNQSCREFRVRENDVGMLLHETEASIISLSQPVEAPPIEPTLWTAMARRCDDESSISWPGYLPDASDEEDGQRREKSGLWKDWLHGGTAHRTITLICPPGAMGQELPASNTPGCDRVPAILFVDRSLTKLMIIPDIMSAMRPITISVTQIRAVCAADAVQAFLGHAERVLYAFEVAKAVLLSYLESSKSGTEPAESADSAPAVERSVCFLEDSDVAKDDCIIALKELCRYAARAAREKAAGESSASADTCVVAGAAPFKEDAVASEVSSCPQ